MNSVNKITLAVLVLCTIGSGSALAQSSTTMSASDSTGAVPTMDYNPSWYIMPSLNMLRPDSEFGVGDHGEGVGFTVGKPLSEDFDLQIGTRYGREHHNGLNYQQNMLGVDGLYMFSRGTVRPFVFVGLGEQEDRLNNQQYRESAYAPYVNAGLGVQLALSDRWSLQLDFRREHGFLRNNAFQESRNNNNCVQIGVSYALGFTPTRPAVMATPAPQPVAYVAPVMAPAPVVAQPKFEKIVLSSTELFGFDQSNLRLPQPKLDEIAQALNNNPQVDHVVISGYTDRIGSDRYNQRLSERRAMAVKDYLINKNVAAARLEAVGKGKSAPIVQCTEKNLKKLIVCLEPNRRVEVEQIQIEQRVEGTK